MRTNLHVGWPQWTAPRFRVRIAAGALALGNAVVYLLIGVGVARVAEAAGGADVSLLAFGLVAGTAFVLGAGLLFFFERRLLWLLGALFQVFAIAMYFVVAPQRTPPYEAWGVSLKVAQVALLVALVYLASTAASRRASLRGASPLRRA
ncbi:MAG: hypothetical protein P8099_18715 [Gemmatimonadota bacterium]|jgi:hypothetical protein